MKLGLRDADMARLLTAARRCAAQSDPEQVLQALLEEAVSLAGADDGGVARWDGERRELTQVRSFLPSRSQGTVLNLERTASGRAALSQAPVIINDYPREGDPSSPAGRIGIRAGMAVPLVHEGKLLGTLSVSTLSEKRFTERDAAALELLAGFGASALVGLEQARLIGALAVRHELFYEVSHDLRTPLTAARAQLQLIERQIDQTNPSPRLREGMTRLGRAIRRMSDLIEQLGDLARLESGQPLELQRRNVNLVALAQDRVAEHASLTPQVGLRVEAAEPTLLGRWDGARLARVLDNLLGNAVKYSPNGGEIVVRIEQRGDRAVLAVHDQGVGIPAADLPRVFERFHRGENVAGRIRGTGIGLAGVRAIVEQHGGAIAVESQEGVGSTFTLELPFDEPPEDGAEP